jgi:putative transposase
MAMIEYIHGNPVRRGLTSRGEDWKWSSAGWVVGKNSLRPDAIDVGGVILYPGGRE